MDCDGNEGEVGESLRLIFKEGVIERKDLHFTSQLMPKDCHPAGAKKAVDGTLLTLGLDYVDLFIVHWPHGRADDFEVRHPCWTASVEANDRHDPLRDNS